MYFSLLQVSMKIPIYKEQRFRTPLDMERSIGLWVDRIGRQRQHRTAAVPFRILGQFAALAVDAGAGDLEILGRPALALQPGDAFLLFPGLPMRYQPNQDWDIRWVVWTGPESTLLQNIGCLSESQPVLTGQAVLVRRAFDHLEPLMDRQDRPSLLQRKTAILDLIRHLDLSRFSTALPPHQTAIRRAQQALEQDPAGEPSIDRLARRHHMSPAYFRRLFKAQTGSSPKTYQRAQRITRAKEWLAGGRSLKETAVELGFSDVFHFMRVFRQVTGQTAGQFIRDPLSRPETRRPTPSR
jgi:AraC-like DNA-binding protein